MATQESAQLINLMVTSKLTCTEDIRDICDQNELSCCTGMLPVFVSISKASSIEHQVDIGKQGIFG